MRYIVRMEQLGDNETRWAVWDTERRSILGLYQCETIALNTAAYHNGASADREARQDRLDQGLEPTGPERPEAVTPDAVTPQVVCAPYIPAGSCS